MRHRQIQGMLQLEGTFVSPTSVYKRLKQNNQVEPYARRAAPWKEPHYEVYQANVMWGADWKKLRIGGMRYIELEYIYNKTVINGSKSYLNNPASLNDFVNSFARFFRSHLAQNPIPLSLTSCKNKSNPLIGIELIRRKSSISAFVFINHFE